MDKITRQTKKIIIGILGGLVVVVGLILIPYPGPGMLIVILGVSILATEFDWAKRLKVFAKRKFKEWETWVSHRNYVVRGFLILSTAIISVFTLWILNFYSFINDFFNLGADWLQSPLI